MPWGCDFTFQNARLNFDQMDRIIKYMNMHNTANMVFRYSTPSEFIQALKNESVRWPVHYDDGFPMRDTNGNYWSG